MSKNKLLPIACAAWAMLAKQLGKSNQGTHRKYVLNNTATVNAFTVDLEDWFQGLTSTNPSVDRWPTLESRVRPATQRLLSILDQHQVKATFFVLGYVADQQPDLIEQIAAAGHELAVHGYYHRFVFKLTPEEFAEELDRSIEALYSITGVQPLGHRAPYFSINEQSSWAFEILNSRGFRYDSSVFPTRNMLYGYPSAPRFPYYLEGTELLEFPATTVRFAGRKWPVGGGFYNRILPYQMTRYAFYQVNNQGEPAVFYIHPWELDTGQNYKKVTFRERITHYFGRAGLEKKLHKMLSDFRFAPLQELFEKMNSPASVEGEKLVAAT